MVLSGNRFASSTHQVQLRADGPRGPGRGLLQLADDVFGRTDVVGLGHDLVAALGVHEHVHPGDALAHLVHACGGEAPVDRAVALPQDHLRVLQLLPGEAAVRAVRVVDHAVVQRQPHLQHGRVAAQVLVGQEQHLLALLEGPVEGSPGVRGGAHGAAVPSAERLDVGAGVHVRDRHHLVGDAGCPPGRPSSPRPG